MYWYLSFVRPPPEVCEPSQRDIVISVQVANDLRTELCKQPYDIYYSFLVGPTLAQASPIKLTTWRPSIEYKNLTIALPPSKKARTAADSCRLALWASLPGGANPQSLGINFHAPDFGQHPFPVISMPITFALPKPDLEAAAIKGKARKIKPPKQERIERKYVLPKFIDENGATRRKVLTITEQTSFDLDKKVWDSGLGLSSWLASLIQPPEENAVALHPLASKIRDVVLSPHGLQALELGAGTGLVSLALSSFLEQKPSSHPRHIITTDLPSAMPLIEHNMVVNASLYTSIQLESDVLDWGDNDFVLSSSFPLGLDLIFMADVTYNTESFDILVHTLDRVFSHPRVDTLGSSSTPIALLAYKVRDPSESALFEMTKAVGIVFERVGEMSGAGGNEVGIYIGQRL